MVEEAREISYKRARQKASYGLEISKQTVKNEVNKLKFHLKMEKEEMNNKYRRNWNTGRKNIL